MAEKQAAIEAISSTINQQSRELTKAQTTLLKEASKFITTAENEANVTLTEVTLKLPEILYIFVTLAETVVSVKESLDITADGVLGNLATDMLSTVQDLRVLANKPARFSQRFKVVTCTSCLEIA